jgi:hypothetical protein
MDALLGQESGSLQRFIPTCFEFCGDEPVIRIDRFTATSREPCLVAGLLDVQGIRSPSRFTACGAKTWSMAFPWENR